MLRTSILLVLLAATLIGCEQQISNEYSVETQLGTLVVRLSDQTPLHSDNFRKLADEGYFNGSLWHRVIPGFMIQGGDPNSKDGSPLNNGLGGPDYKIPAEMRPELFHKRGALAAARQGQGNPEMASNGSQFYIVVGRKYTDEELDSIEQQFSQRDRAPFKFPAGHREVYKTEGGVPWLDGQYTVYGELVEGFEVLDAISRVDTPNMRGDATSPALGDQPLDPLPMVVRPHRP
ncbi:MAG: cyclophilin family peptidyl-prolyl cis-trans isomerase [Rhodothermales bacterium]|jgi:cyclophilin family peptidyl-prolyl cis-trans isomerase